jgi:hypothetical protein
VEGPPFLGGHQEVRIGDLAYAADVVLVEMGDHRGGHVLGAVAEPRQAGGEGLVVADVESGEAAVDQPVGAAVGEVAGVGDRGSVLAGVEQHDPVGVLDEINVDRAAGQPLSRGEDPPVHR